MKHWLMYLVVGLLALGTPARADIVGEEETEGTGGINTGPIRAGQLEVTPIISWRFSSGNFFYRAGIQVAYSINQWHQIGGAFVAGNRDRFERSGLPGSQDDLQVIDNATVDARGRYLSTSEGFGSSVSGFYRMNIPIKIQRRTFPFLELFAARDFWGWGNVSELGGGAGIRKMVSKRTAMNATYGYSVLFANNTRTPRHFVTVGMSVFFR